MYFDYFIIFILCLYIIWKKVFDLIETNIFQVWIENKIIHPPHCPKIELSTPKYHLSVDMYFLNNI